MLKKRKETKEEVKRFHCEGWALSIPAFYSTFITGICLTERAWKKR